MISKVLFKSSLTLAALLTLSFAAWGQCSNATFNGKYGYSGGGLNPSGNPANFMGYLKSDGAGNFKGIQSGSENGSVYTNVATTGKYKIKSDCTGSGTIKLKGSKSSGTFALVMVAGGKGVQILNTDSPNVQAGSGQAQGKQTCTVAGVKGSFGLEATGVFIGVGAVALDGLIKLDGAGNVSGTESGSLAGEIFTNQAISGTYTVASNCTGTTSLLVLGQTLNASFVLVNGGKNMLVIETDADTVVSGFGQQ